MSKNILKNNGFNNSEIAKEAYKISKKILNDENLKFIFAENSTAELPFQIHLPKLNNLLVSGIIDRVINNKNEIIAVDFKSNLLVPENNKNIPTGVLNQMAIYQEALSIIYPDKEIKLAILWVQNSTLMYLDKLHLRNLLDQSLALDLLKFDS